MKRLTIVFAIFVSLTALLYGCTTTPYKLEKLSSPQNFVLEERTIIWNTVDNADGYEIEFNGELTKTNKPTFTLPNTLDFGKYEIKVLSIGDFKQYEDSDWATFLFELKDNTPEQDKTYYDELGFAYTLLSDGTGYEFSIGKYNQLGDIEIPTYFNGLPVKKVADYAFQFKPTGGMTPVAPNPLTGSFCNTATTGVVIPNTIEEIGKYAFGCMIKVKEFIIPDSVTKIGRNAFHGCTNLTKVSLPKNLKVIPISCFENCALQEITFPNGLEEIEEAAFECFYYETASKNLHTEQNFERIDIPNSVRKIGNAAFASCLKLKHITLPENLDYFGRNVFMDTPWYDEQPNNSAIIIDNLFYKYKGDIKGSYTIPKTVKYIAGDAFINKNNLTEIIIPNGVKLIGTDTFGLCESLKNVKLPEDLTIIPKKTFYLCSSLYNIDLPIELKVIEESAFGKCPSLTDIYLPKGLKEIGQLAFYNCDSLSKVIIPKSVVSLKTQPFRSCENLTNIFYEGTQHEWNLLVEKHNKPPVEAPFSKAEICYYSETQQTDTATKYWRYVNNIATIWEM